MAVITGHLGLNGTHSPFVGRSTNLATIAEINHSPDGEQATLALTSSITDAQPLTLYTQAVTGYIAPAFSDIFYNRILVEPVSIALGNLIAEQTRVIKVFNGYFEDRTLETIDQISVDGLMLVGDATPTTFAALQEREYTVTISLDGPPPIAAQYIFNFAGTDDDVTVNITGSRIVLIPYYGSAPATEILEWNTNTLIATDGSEQRVRLRTKPRQRLNYN